MLTLPALIVILKLITTAIVIFGVYQVSDMITDLTELFKRN